MPFPPVVPPATRTNTTPQLDSHPSDHNAIATALATLVAMLTNAPRGYAGHTIAFAGAGTAATTVATLNVAAKAGRKYQLTGQLAGTGSVVSRCYVQVFDGATKLTEGVTAPVVAGAYMTFPLNGIFDGGAADRTAVITVKVLTDSGTFTSDGGANRSMLVCNDVGPTTPVAVP